MMEEATRRSFVLRATAPNGAQGRPTTIVTRALLGSDAGLYGTARLPLAAAGASQARRTA
jgi:hypothetical protein